MATGRPKQKTEADWYQIAEEFLITQEARPSLTVKEFCTMRKDLKYNTARVKLNPKIKELAKKKEVDQVDQKPNKSDKPKHKGFNSPLNKSKNKGSTVEKLDVRAHHGIYGKYFKPEVLELAAKGKLDDDLVLYRAKALNALDFMELLQSDLNDATEQLTRSPDNDVLKENVKILETKIATTDKALSWCITRIESIAMTIKKIELTSVMISKERANVIKAKAQTRMTLHQSNKYKADAKLAKAKAYELEHGNKGDVVDDIVKEIQTRRDLLPSFVNKEAK